MNNTFNINRFGLLLRRQWLDFGKIYLISFGVLIGILAFIYAISLTDERLKYISFNTLNFRYPLFLITGLLFVSIIANSYFMQLGQKSKAIINILTPASTIEKFLCGIFYTVIVALPSYLLCFYLTDLIFVSSIRATHTLVTSYNDYNGKKVVIDNLAYFFSTPTVKQFLQFYYVPFLINAVFLLGSIFFQSFHYIKTAISVMAFGVIWVTLTIFIIKKLTDNTVWVGSHYWQDEQNIYFLISLMSILITLVFWFISFIRLKEKEA
ncbi:hypothetical protein ASE74_03910 [Pedobacter sp. Leaf216]|uniref:hypothetical protein n=1 Tax=Pedobacter sp. Leaf216 TaxID=1735684 RepID=UPI0007022CAB|nr:hypothetical protein [Pedobacter sp. Leaf216]KQM75127.1 hypothetical protein ASE74_03910 [Pedobacter sp. Leaf216]